MKFTLICTFVEDPKSLWVLIDSIRCQIDADVDLFVVYQSKCHQPEIIDKISCLQTDKFSINVVKSECMGLSSARNIALNEYYERNTTSNERDDLLLFPDDDCWYPKDFFKYVEGLDWSEMDVVCTSVFDPIANEKFGRRPLNKRIEIGYHNAFELPISVGIICKSAVFRRSIKCFDDNYGIGADINSGEETKVILGLLKANAIIVYDGFVAVFHEIYVMNDSALKKMKSYAFGQGRCMYLFAKEFSIKIFIYFLLICIRSMGGILLKPGFRRFYALRLYGLISGFSYQAIIKKNHTELK